MQIAAPKPTPPAYAISRGVQGFEYAIHRMETALEALDRGNDRKAGSMSGGACAMFAGALTVLQYHRPTDAKSIAAVTDAMNGSHLLAIEMEDPAKRPTNDVFRTKITGWIDVARAAIDVLGQTTPPAAFTIQ